MFTEKDSIISPVITFASTLVVLFSVMCPGELIILKETKAILFPVSQDANLFWLVILLWGRTAAALGIKARSNTARPPCLCMCTSGFKLTKKNPQKHSNVVLVELVLIKAQMIWLNFKPPSELQTFLEGEHLLGAWQATADQC